MHTACTQLMTLSDGYCGLVRRDSYKEFARWGVPGSQYVRRLLGVHPDYSVAWIEHLWGPLMQRTPGALASYVQGSRLIGGGANHAGLASTAKMGQEFASRDA